MPCMGGASMPILDVFGRTTDPAGAQFSTANQQPDQLFAPDNNTKVSNEITSADLAAQTIMSTRGQPPEQVTVKSTGESTGYSSVGQPGFEHLDSSLSTPEIEAGESPESLHLQWASPVTQVPEGPCWVHEVELAGQRLLVSVDDGRVRLHSVDRRGREPLDWTEKLPELARDLAVPALAGCVVDGVLCGLGPDGLSSRVQLEQALAAGCTDELVLFVFDLPFVDGRDLRRAPLVERKRLLRARVEGLGPRVRFCEHVLGAGAKVFDRACELGLEGVVSKRVDSPYESVARGEGEEGEGEPAWVEVKCARRLNLVVGGFTAPHGSRRYLGALLLGSYDEQGRLIYRGKVGSGFCEDSLARLRPQLEQLRQDQPPFFDPPVGSQARGVSWVTPTLGVEVEYGEMTDKGKLRHARFKGLREDSTNKDKQADSSAAASEPSTRGGARGGARGVASVASGGESEAASELRPEDGLAMVRLSDPDKQVYPALGLSKRDLADYTVAVAEWMLPHVRGRALTVVCCPDGVEGAHIEYRHAHEGRIVGIAEADLPEGVALQRVTDRAGSELRCLSIVDALGLLGLVEMNVVEVHTWGSRIDKIDHPDRLLFTLEPDVGLEFARVAEAAMELRDRLAEFGLASFVKTSGQQQRSGGLDVVVPVQRRRAYGPVARFCRVFAERMVGAAPSRYTTSSADRRGKILINHRCNNRQSTMLAPYSVRASPDARVSTPIGWNELARLAVDGDMNPSRFDLPRVTARIAQLGHDPWAGFFELRQWITKATFRRVGINPDLRGFASPEPGARA